jgi:hypothetical protein
LRQAIQFLRNPNVQFWSYIAVALIWVPVALVTGNAGLLGVGGAFVALAISIRAGQRATDEQRRRLRLLLGVAIALLGATFLAGIAVFVLKS